jgi:hypothetical protein
MRQQLALYHTSYNFCLPHASLRQALPESGPTNGAGSAKKWRLQTPAMTAGLTDHVWTLREVLLYRVPLWHSPRSFKRELSRTIMGGRGLGVSASRQSRLHQAL